MVLRVFLSLLVLLPAALQAEAPRVVADIAPVHSLVARVMEGVGSPKLLLPPGTSPHGYAMRPSDAAALQEADLVVWIGPALTPSLARATESLAEDARELSLLEADGTVRLHTREAVVFEGTRTYEEVHAEHHGSDEAHDEHHDGDGEHDAHHGADDAEAGEHDHHGHDAHGPYDPHAWLDPENARTWLGLIAEDLADLDPENAQTYRDNAAAARAELAGLTGEIAAVLEPARDTTFLVYHDAYQYFEHRFDLTALGAVSMSDAVAPGAARMAALRDLLAAREPRCIFYEPQTSPRLIDTLAQGAELQAAELDPMGLALTPGPGLYPAVLRDMAQAIAGCR
jgi:zinc transport system substrate-binding protein